MSKRRQADPQLYLFERRLRWQEFPPETRQQLIKLFAALCREILDESNPRLQIQERSHERTQD